jgi:hypothetical protein
MAARSRSQAVSYLRFGNAVFCAALNVRLESVFVCVCAVVNSHFEREAVHSVQLISFHFANDPFNSNTYFSIFHSDIFST